MKNEIEKAFISESISHFTIKLVIQILVRIYNKTICVVATTRRNSTCDMLTSAKLSVGYLVVGITRELDKEPSLHYFSIYINTM